jgi:hypothetical protein
MSSVNYVAMSDQALRQYFLAYRDGSVALWAYLNRRKVRSQSIVTTIDDPDFDDKLQDAIQQQISDFRRMG